MADSPFPTAPPWMRTVMLAAAAYNIAWGAWVVLAPQSAFALFDMAPINYASVWQSVGMIVGVYGIGYGISATDVYRHWPIILVGFLGKVFGPIGLAQKVWLEGELPLRFGWINVFNDLIWILPFFLILRWVWRASRARGATSLLP